eukprot:CAMPEP_0180178530 /NCGR_PEP_ID=MMETSP0986-20121125/38475_1 /TAXON_ID=697907 /ORGANISM="non described non described, Strain CCMP2293" /LENGTH=347 /DNA_ID=CAMNT_0022131425 /DNA_START=214 /DNA_END=1255 /DNA_ORIENTATION=-
MAHSQGAVSLLEAIASMDEPFDPPDLVALPAAASLRGQACLPVMGRHATDAHHPGNAGHDEENCIDCWLYRTAHVPWQAAAAPVKQQRRQSQSVLEYPKRAHSAAFGAEGASAAGACGEFQWGLAEAGATAQAHRSRCNNRACESERFSTDVAHDARGRRGKIRAVSQQRPVPPVQLGGGHDAPSSPKSAGILKRGRSSPTTDGENDKDTLRGIVVREQKLDRMLDRQVADGEDKVKKRGERLDRLLDQQIREGEWLPPARPTTTFDKPAREVDVGATLSTVWDSIFVKEPGMDSRTSPPWEAGTSPPRGAKPGVWDTLFVAPLFDLVDKLKVDKGGDRPPSPLASW